MCTLYDARLVDPVLCTEDGEDLDGAEGAEDVGVVVRVRAERAWHG
jgi:hypothetical protein